MSNPSKAKGTAAETAILKYVRANGFPWAERLALSGAADCGDISLLPGRLIVLEAKAHASAATGQPGDAQLADWMRQTRSERVNAGADYGVLVVKRKGTADPGRWFAYVTADQFAMLLGADLDLPNPHAPMCMSLASLLPVLRRAGYGSQLEQEATEVTA